MLHSFADALHPAEAALHAEGHVGPQASPHLHQLPGVEPQVPKPVQGHQRHGAVGAAAPQAGADGNALGHFNARAHGPTGNLAQGGGGPNHQIFPAPGHHTAVYGQGKVPGAGEDDFIVQGDALHEHIHFVITVLPGGKDVQRPVDFGKSLCRDAHVAIPPPLVSGGL